MKSQHIIKVQILGNFLTIICLIGFKNRVCEVLNPHRSIISLFLSYLILSADAGLRENSRDLRIGLFAFAP